MLKECEGGPLVSRRQVNNERQKERARSQKGRGVGRHLMHPGDLGWFGQGDCALRHVRRSDLREMRRTVPGALGPGGHGVGMAQQDLSIAPHRRFHVSTIGNL